MHQAERVLLYLLAVMVGVFLLMDHGPSTSSPPTKKTVHHVSQVAPDLRIEREPLKSKPEAAATSPQNEVATPRNELVLSDEQGRPRIELRLGPGGAPMISLNDAAGQPVIKLAVRGDRTAEVTVHHGARRAGITSQADGSLSLGVDSDSRRSHLTVLPNDETELSLSGPRGVKTLLRADRHGGAEIAIQRADGSAGPAMSLMPAGEAGLGVRSRDGSGPVMQLFPDGLAEVSINGANSQSGPSLIRLPDGTSILAAKRPSGQPGASMVVSPNGEAVIAAINDAGNQEAALRIDAAGTAAVFTTDPKQRSPIKTIPRLPARPRLPRQGPTAMLDRAGTP